MPFKNIPSISVDVNMDNLNTDVSMMIQIYLDLCSSASFIHHIFVDPLLMYYFPFNTGAYDTPCLSNPCRNGGTCVLQGTNGDAYKCICPAGYTGTQCQTRISE